MCEGPESHRGPGAVRDRQLTLKFLRPNLHAHADLRSLALVYILSIGMCCGMRGVQSHHYDRIWIRRGDTESYHGKPNTLYSPGCRYHCCLQ